MSQACSLHTRGIHTLYVLRQRCKQLLVQVKGDRDIGWCHAFQPVGSSDVWVRIVERSNGNDDVDNL